ncbi:aspartyl protease family protein At5g10770-like [Panicum virgatum]|uniref:aspartyl protease family protein At5g10770-like n=1 Tax=Panicum virgatum TaxID=38727 RepID=UPI0019D546EE|nr:aspartyl protease family protein At5g10770-like [Panicum virgatum]
MWPAGASNSSALKVVHRHGPCSPLRSRGAAPSPVEILRRDRDRANSMLRRIAGASATNAARASNGVRMPAHWATATLGTNNYVVTVGLGTPARYFTVEFDTGSDLSWVQCKPCKDCYEQNDPLFDPAKSPTFSTVPCGARECRELHPQSQSCSPDNRCRFECAYADGSQTDGDLARDTLTLTPSDAIRGFVFGCGHQNSGFFGTEDGLIGLGRKSVSLSSQAAGRYGPGFSYCLPSLSSGTGYLALGGGAPANAQFTPMVPSRALPSLYFLRLTGIMVAGKAVKVPAASMLIDSGTQLTSLPDGTFAALWSAFARLMTGRYRRAPGLSFLDTCYNFTGHAALQVPSVALVFAGGATVNLDVSGVLVKLGSDEPNVACLAFTSSGDDTPTGILGNQQQKTFAVVYDVANQRVGFGAKGCA